MLVKANAKINLILNVYDKREDGYHNVEFLMVPIDLYDEIEINLSDEMKINTPGVELEDNLIYKAVKLIKDTYNITNNFSIDVKKNIPQGGGLAGGSSDASFVLKAINQLCDLNITDEELIALSARLGSDCPFFIKNKPSIISGRGEIIEVVDFSLDNEIIIINPGSHLSTKAVFDNYQNTNKHGDITKFINTKDLKLLHNDLTTSSRLLDDKLDALLNDLDNLSVNYLMSGSGSSCFVVLDKSSNKNDIIKYLENKYPLVVCTKVLN